MNFGSTVVHPLILNAGTPTGSTGGQISAKESGTLLATLQMCESFNLLLTFLVLRGSKIAFSGPICFIVKASLWTVILHV